MSDVMTEPEKDKDKQSNGERRISDIELKRAILKAVQEKKRAELKRMRAGRTRGRSALKTPYGIPAAAKVIEKESYIFSPKELFSLYVTSPQFREIFNSGRYIYVNNRLVMKSKECICISEGNIETIVKDNELNQYCLSKSIWATILIPAGTGPVRTPKKNLEHKVYSFKDAEKIDSIKSLGNNNLYLFFGGGQEPPNNFNDLFVSFMDTRGITVEQLSAETGVSTKTIQRMRSKPNPKPTLQSLIAVSVGLHLSVYQSGKLLRFAGFNLDSPDPLFQAYSLCLNMACNSTVEECNYFLIQMGEKPLTNLYNKEKAKSLPKFKIVPPINLDRNNRGKRK